MKRIRVIPSILSALLIITVLLGSEGITLIIHTCKTCDFTSVNRLSESESSLANEECCCHVPEGIPSGMNAVNSDCCDYRIEQLALPSYVKSEYRDFSLLTYFLLTAPVFSVPPFTEQPLLTDDTAFKPGGRFLVNYNCQILS